MTTSNLRFSRFGISPEIALAAWSVGAIAMNRHDPWAHHAVAHVMETQGRFDDGIAWMESLADTWENCNSMLYTHNWWHVALYYLERGDEEKVLALYHTRVFRCFIANPKAESFFISDLLNLACVKIVDSRPGLNTVRLKLKIETNVGWIVASVIITV